MAKRRIRKSRPGRRVEIARTRWILGIATSPKAWRGLKAEERALEALGYHQKKKKEFPGQRVITKIEPTLHYSPDDYRGIDIIVTFQNGETLPIQIQNWWSREAENEFREKGICLIVIWPDEDKEMARKRVFEAISNWFSSVKRVPESI